MSFANLILFGQQDDGTGIIEIIGTLIYLAVCIVCIAGMWAVFVKAGKPGWAALIPIYNIVVLLEIVGRPIWFLILFFIPCVNFIAIAILLIDLAKSFGKDAAYGIGLFLLSFIFIPLLGFGDARYIGPSVKS